MSEPWGGGGVSRAPQGQEERGRSVVFDPANEGFSVTLGKDACDEALEDDAAFFQGGVFQGVEDVLGEFG